MSGFACWAEVSVTRGVTDTESVMSFQNSGYRISWRVEESGYRIQVSDRSLTAGYGEHKSKVNRLWPVWPQQFWPVWLHGKKHKLIGLYFCPKSLNLTVSLEFELRLPRISRVPKKVCIQLN